MIGGQIVNEFAFVVPPDLEHNPNPET